MRRAGKTRDVPAASPGAVKRINASLLRSRLVSSGYDVQQFEITGAENVNATTLSIELSKEMLVYYLLRFFVSEMPWDATDATVDIEMPSAGLTVPEGDVALEWSPTPLYSTSAREPSAVRWSSTAKCAMSSTARWIAGVWRCCS